MIILVLLRFSLNLGGLMGAYTEYLDTLHDFPQINEERKRILKQISVLREGRDILVYASDRGGSIDIEDKLPFYEQLQQLGKKSRGIDIILETPGGLAEVVEDFIITLHHEYDHVAVIIPGMAMSAGTIFAMGANEILMGKMSALGPIDAQMIVSGKRLSVEAQLTGLEKIKDECAQTGRLNPAYIPMLQQLSPGEIQNWVNVSEFSKKLVGKWLAEYKFSTWHKHSKSGLAVTEEEREMRAEEIAEKLCDHSSWLTHGRNFKIDRLRDMKLLITDYSESPELEDAISRYYALLHMSFERSNIYKIFETPNSQIYKFRNIQNQGVAIPQRPIPGNGEPNSVDIEIECPNCNNHMKLQGNLGRSKPIKNGFLPFPIKDNKVICPNCKTVIDVSKMRMQIEAQTRKPFV